MRNDLIRAILDCGTDDLSLLDDSGADLFKVVERMRFEGLEITLKPGSILKGRCGGYGCLYGCWV